MEVQNDLGHFAPLQCSFRYSIAVKLCFLCQVAGRGVRNHLLTLLLGHLGMKTENLWCQEEEIGEVETDSSA